MNTQTVSLADIHPDPRNARRHDERNLAEIRRSLERFGQYRPFVVQRDGMIIRAGNGMYEAMRQLGWTEGEAVILELSEAEARALAVMDNRSAELAEWDLDTLTEILDDLPDELLEVTGFEEDEIEALLEGMDDLPPPPPEDPDPGDRSGQADTVCIVGAFRFGVDRAAYERFIEEVRQESGFDDASIISGIRERLGL